MLTGMPAYEPAPEHIQRVTRRAGRAHVTGTLTAARTALLIVDMQRYFVEEGMPAASAGARALLPRIAAAAEALRARGVVIIWIMTDADARAARDWPSYEALFTPQGWAARQTLLAPDGAGYPLADGLEPSSADLVVVKHRHSGFVGAAPGLERILRDRGIDTALVAGTATGVCCTATARDAMTHGFHTILLSDLTAAQSDEEHEAALAAHYLYFGDVLSVHEVLARLA